ncbi:hypothetical protein HLB35_13115 [Halomonas sp. TBZ9]|uniref:Uncharacterized protein n=1 Tax=Vreelandella azerica TaxID=2732867 RepID=A0A7Y3XA73_9GAMM|nr:hypothetical protein [Halomonas azerica]NOG32457.1 hypothetical protein [Halomonas azerica]
MAPPPEAMVGQRWLDACPCDEHHKWIELYPKFTPDAPCHRICNQATSADGQPRWVEWINTAFLMMPVISFTFRGRD